MTDHPHAELLRQAYAAFQYGRMEPLLDTYVSAEYQRFWDRGTAPT